MENKKTLDSYFEHSLFQNVWQRFRRGYETASISYNLTNYRWNNWKKIANVGEERFDYPKEMTEVNKRINESINDPLQSLAGFWYTLTHPIKTFVEIIKDYVSRVNYVNSRRMVSEII